jgi:DNA-binding response OmpR family regulator
MAMTMSDDRGLARGEGRKAPTILVIDDEDYVADMLAMALDIEGYTVHVAYNGRQGLDSARSFPADLVIIDIMMPYLSGEQLAEQLRQQDPMRDVPIIMISAGARPLFQLRDTTFVRKPFDLEHMLDLVKARVGRSEANI